MYYEIYIDQFFVEHLLTGFLLLRLSAQMGQSQTSWKKIALAGIVNAGAVTLSVTICTMDLWRRDFWYAVVLAAGYLGGILAAGYIAFSGEQGRPVRQLPILLTTAILFGGIWRVVQRLTGLPGLASSALSAGVLELLIRSREKKRLKRERTAEVTIYWEEKKQVLTGIIDTGNLLREPLTGKAVSIVEKAGIAPLLGNTWQQRRGFYLIPYHSIGTDKGWLQAVAADKMEIQAAGRRVCVPHPILAIYEGNLSAQKEYQIILHPQHVN